MDACPPQTQDASSLSLSGLQLCLSVRNRRPLMAPKQLEASVPSANAREDVKKDDARPAETGQWRVDLFLEKVSKAK